MAENDEVRLRVSLSGRRKATSGNFMMHVFGFTSAHFAATAGQFSRKFASGFPPGSARIATTSGPSWVSGFANVLRLPFGHAKIVAKSFLGMKIRSRSCHGLAAPRASFSYSVGASRVKSPDFAYLGAIPRTEFLVEFAGASARVSAYCARIARSWFSHAENLITNLAASTLIEIEEKYCEIAAKRMAQEVLPL